MANTVNIIMEFVSSFVYIDAPGSNSISAQEATLNHSKQTIQILFMASFLLVGCRPDSSGKTTSNSTKNLPNESTNSKNPVGTTEVPKVLGELPSFNLIDQNGQSFDAASLSGKVSILNFIFTTCPGTCPQQSKRMSELQNRLSQNELDKGIRLVSFSVDPETDTPEVLQRYSEIYEADDSIWKFLTGKKDEIWKLSSQGLKLPVAPNPDDPLIPIAHASQFVLVDRMGQVRGYYDLEDGLDSLWKDIGTILPEFQPALESWPRLQNETDLTHLAQPPEIMETTWLSEQANRERKSLQNSSTRTDFKFLNVRDDSGITFSPQIVDDQRWRLLVNHYDHGNSISIADVDGDGNDDIYFVSQVGPNELWKNRGNGTFENITSQAGVGLADRVCVAGSFADIDNDGDPDLFVTSVRGGNALFLNDGKGKFHDISKDAGLDYTGHSSTGMFFDFDRDGLLDLFLTNVGKYTTEEYANVRKDLCHSQPETEISYYVGRKDAFAGHLKPELTERSILYRNLGEDKFEDVSKKVGLLDESWSGDSVPLDVNNDGWLDIYVMNMQGNDHLYLNEEGKHFSDETSKYFPQTPWGAMGGGVVDYNRDGQFDLFLTDMHSDMSEDIGPEREKLKSRMQWPPEFLKTKDSSIFGNALFERTPELEYSEVSDAAGAENYWPWGISIGDVNADGFQDVFVASSMCFPYRYGYNSLLMNESGKRFVDAQFTTQIEPRPQSEMLAPWFSLDCEEESESPFCAGRSGTVVVWSATGTRSSALFDYDGDGDLDLFTNEFNSQPLVFRSDLAEQDGLNYLKVKLQGKKSNRNGLGAIVTLKTKGSTQKQSYDGKSGYLSQSLLPLYFGLGEETQIDEIEILWPSGVVQKVTGPIESNQTLTITESDQE